MIEVVIEIGSKGNELVVGARAQHDDNNSEAAHKLAHEILAHFTEYMNGRMSEWRKAMYIEDSKNSDIAKKQRKDFGLPD